MRDFGIFIVALIVLTIELIKSSQKRSVLAFDRTNGLISVNLV
ncbi:hypothetical protein [Lactiplantibacillus plantarum]